MTIRFSSGEVLRISKTPLGSGGEGRVYRVANQSKQGLVAKIYNHLPDISRQEKLKSMVQITNTSLLGSCAWPVDVLFDSKSGDICGFTMHEVTESEPIHHFYSPSWRKQNQPNASWDNLLQLALNLTAAFRVVHQLGIIVGDVNPNSLRVRKNGRVVLIDADSFQISHAGVTYGCKVGVPSFTAPELLTANKPFKLLTRSLNHDLFGLSLLLFHLLFMGRHPFAGIYSGRGDTPLETHIKEYRYAYALDHVRRGLLPPPLSINPRLLASPRISELFENDFTQLGTAKGRTNSLQWFEAIQEQRQRLTRCRHNRYHLHDQSINTCIWCELECKGLAYFESNQGLKSALQGHEAQDKYTPADLLPTKAEEQAWLRASSRIGKGSIVCPPSTNIAGPIHELTVLDKRDILKRSIVRFISCLGLLLPLITSSLSLAPLFIVLCITSFAYSPQHLRLLISRYSSKLSQVEAQVSAARKGRDSLLSQDRREEFLLAVRSQWNRLTSIKNQYDSECEKRLSVIREKHLDAYLRSFLISDAAIPGIGPGRSSTLASYGIETAADISESALIRINGFGPVLISTLVSWREWQLKNYNPSSDGSILRKEKHRLLLEYIKSRRKAAADFQLAVESLDQYCCEFISKITSYEQRIADGMQHAAAIKADMKLLRQPASAVYGGKYAFLIF